MLNRESCLCPELREVTKAPQFRVLGLGTPQNRQSSWGHGDDRPRELRNTNSSFGKDMVPTTVGFNAVKKDRSLISTPKHVASVLGGF